MTSRLLFAAARGARVQVRVFEFDKWVNSSGMRFGYPYAYRIHPDDAHLQYGPVSTALRTRVIDDNPWSPEGTWTFTNGTFWMPLEDWLHWDKCRGELHRALFLLILAEALADEGL